MSVEGPFRTDRTDVLELLPGPLYVRGPSMNPMNADVCFRHCAACGFNLFRMSQRNCSYDLYRDLDHYLVQEGIMTDELLRHVRKYGYRVMYGLFGCHKVFNDHPDNAEAMAKIKVHPNPAYFVASCCCLGVSRHPQQARQSEERRDGYGVRFQNKGDGFPSPRSGGRAVSIGRSPHAETLDNHGKTDLILVSRALLASNPIERRGGPRFPPGVAALSLCVPFPLF
jgi:hypothetical protein